MGLFGKYPVKIGEDVWVDNIDQDEYKQLLLDLKFVIDAHRKVEKQYIHWGWGDRALTHATHRHMLILLAKLARINLKGDGEHDTKN